ncbi:hypothetical protein BDV3_001973 [Batrachochytrium dendrobatidis]
MESATYQPVASETKLAATQHSNRKKQLLERDTLLLKPNTSKPLLQSPAPVVTSKMGLLKTFILCLIVSGSTLGGLVLLIKRVWWNPYQLIFQVYRKHVSKRSKMITAFMPALSSLLKLYSNTSQSRSEPSDSLKSSPSIPETLRRSVEMSTAKMNQVHKLLIDLLDSRSCSGSTIVSTIDANMADIGRVNVNHRGSDGLGNVKQSLGDMVLMLSGELYGGNTEMSRYYGYGKTSDWTNSFCNQDKNREREKVEQVRSEIRGLKGMLISRRNFPSAMQA